MTSTIDIVTGGAGFIGSHLVRRLVQRGRHVRVIDDVSTGDEERLADVRQRIEFIRADLATAELRPFLGETARIFHLAAVPSVPRSVSDPIRTHTAVATATLRLLVAARDARVQRVVVSSSSSVYGETEVSPKHEDLEPRPMSPYGIAKLAAELYTRNFTRLFGLPTVSLRYFNVFGPSQDPLSPYAAVIPKFIMLAMAGKPVPVRGDGEQTRDFTYVDNVVEANLAAAHPEAPSGGVYNIAAGRPRSVNDLVRELGLILGRQLTVQRVPPSAGDIRHSQADIGAAERDLGWHPTVTFVEGLRRTVDWYRTRL